MMIRLSFCIIVILVALNAVQEVASFSTSPIVNRHYLQQHQHGHFRHELSQARHVPHGASSSYAVPPLAAKITTTTRRRMTKLSSSSATARCSRNKRSAHDGFMSLHSTAANHNDNNKASFSFAKTLPLLTPVLLTLLASIVGLLPTSRTASASASMTTYYYSTVMTWIQHSCHQLSTLQTALAVLMMTMGFSITPSQLQAAWQQPLVLVLNLVFCFVAMPLVALGVTASLPNTMASSSLVIGTLLMGCVSGGQASNLFTMIAKGDVALSVICTLSTTLVGVVATPLLVQTLLGTSVPVQFAGVLKSIARLVLVPLLSGLLLGNILTRLSNNNKQSSSSSSSFLQTIRDKYCQRLGLASTMILVAGGSTSAAKTFTSMALTSKSARRFLFSASIAISVLLPLVGGLASWATCALLQKQGKQPQQSAPPPPPPPPRKRPSSKLPDPIQRALRQNSPFDYELAAAPSPQPAASVEKEVMPERSKRALVIEVLSKSPTLAHVLALKHFGVEAALIPAVSMVSLAVVGALVASIWQGVDPIR